MCKHCNIDEWDELKYIATKKKVIKIGQAPVAEEGLYVSINRNDKKKLWTLEFERAVFGSNDQGDFLKTRLAIKYCPFCGDKLADRFNQD